jgi:hypothetical protein
LAALPGVLGFLYEQLCLEGQVFGRMKVLQSGYGWEAQTGPRLGRNGLAMALCIVVVLGAGLRAYALDFQSLWTDEIASLMITDPMLPFRQFWERVLADTHPPIYYLVLRWFSSAFGQSEIVARAPSVLFGILTVCAAGIFPRTLLSVSSRVALPLLLAVSPGAVWYGREVRSYALLLMLSTLITVACIRLLRCLPHEDRAARGALTMITMAALLASFTHYFGFLLAMAAFFTCFLLVDSRHRAIVVLSGCGVAALFTPWVVYHSRFITSKQATWIGELSVSASIDWFKHLAFGGTLSLLVFIGAVMAVLTTEGRHSRVALNSTIGACALLCLLTLAAAAAISLHTPILTSRNMIVVLPAVYVIAAELTSCLMHRWGTIVGATYLALQIGLMCQALTVYYTIDINEQWRDSAALVLGTPDCASGDIHVYGNASNYHFFTQSVRPNLQLIEIPLGAAADLGNEPTTTRCPIVLWIVGVAAWNLDGLLDRLGLSRSSSEVAEYHWAYVIFRKDP